MKRSRAWRIKQKQRVIKKRINDAKVIGYVDDSLFEEQNRLSKQHPNDCGNAKCALCHGDKNGLEKDHRQEKILSVKEELEAEEL